MSLIVVTGPPASGKSTWVLERAQPGDIVIDYDRLAVALTGTGADGHDHGQALRAVTAAARRAAIAVAVQHRDLVDVYVIHSSPGARPLAEYQRLGARVVTVDPGRDVVLARCRRERPAQMVGVAKRWYADAPDQEISLPTSRDW